VFSAIGFYPLCPGNTNYILGIPNFKNIKIKLANNQEAVIENKIKLNHSPLMVTNGNTLLPGWVAHHQLANAVLQFIDKPKSVLKQDTIPPSYYTAAVGKMEVVPFFNNPGKNFVDQFEVVINTITKNQSAIYYAIDRGEYAVYEHPFIVKNNCTIHAYSVNKLSGLKSDIVTCDFVKLPAGRSVQIVNAYDNQYTAGGDNALIDLQRGSSNWHIGAWQGYSAKDFVAILDLSTPKQLKNIGLGCLQDQDAWIMMPNAVIFEGSNDGKTFELIHTVYPGVSDTIDHALTKDIKSQPQKPYRYFKVTAKNYGKLPTWHWSKGEPAWLFVDEIIVEE
jgi:hypothetical protein